MHYQEFARVCIRLSLDADPDLRDMLLRLARLWVRAALRKQGRVTA
jgi:hypothetical protein